MSTLAWIVAGVVAYLCALALVLALLATNHRLDAEVASWRRWSERGDPIGERARRLK